MGKSGPLWWSNGLHKHFVLRLHVKIRNHSFSLRKTDNSWRSWPDFWLQKWCDAMQNLLTNAFPSSLFALCRDWACSWYALFPTLRCTGLAWCRSSLARIVKIMRWVRSVLVHTLSKPLSIPTFTQFAEIIVFSLGNGLFAHDPLVFTPTWRASNWLCPTPPSFTKC